MAERVSKAELGGVENGEPGEEAAGELAKKVAEAAERKPSSSAAPEAAKTAEAAPESMTSSTALKTGKPTRYLVLESLSVRMGAEDTEMWRPVGEFDGPKPLDGAHTQLADSERSEHGALVAVPARSWKPKRAVEKPRPPVVFWE